MKEHLLRLFMITVMMVPAVSCGRAQSARNQGYLGATLGDLTPKLERKHDIPVHRGAYISDVVQDGPAERAGIKEGDVIVGFDGKEIEDTGDLISDVRKAKPASDVTVELYRGKEKRTVTVTVGKLPREDAYSFLFGDGSARGSPRIMRVPRPPGAPRLYAFSGSELYGLNTQDLSGQLARYFEVPGGSGVLVLEVEKESDAEKAGFKAGDVIVKAGPRAVEDITDLGRVLEKAGQGDEVAFGVIRRGKPLSLTMKLTEDETSYGGSRFFRRFEGLPGGGSDRLALVKGHLRKYWDVALEHLKRLEVRLEKSFERL